MNAPTSHVKEAIYDEKFKPLIGQLFQLAQEHKIPCVMSFDITDDVDREVGEHVSSTMVNGGEVPSSYRIADACRAIKGEDESPLAGLFAALAAMRQAEEEEEAAPIQ